MPHPALSNGMEEALKKVKAAAWCKQGTH